MQHYSTNSADFGAYFTALDADHWQCKQNGHIIQFGIKSFFSELSIDGQTLPMVGLPLTNEIYLGNQLVLQIFERASVCYDPAHVKDSQPGTGDCYLCHLNDPDVLKNVPGLPPPTPTPINPDVVAQLETASAALQKALSELK